MAGRCCCKAAARGTQSLQPEQWMHAGQMQQSAASETKPCRRRSSFVVNGMDVSGNRTVSVSFCNGEMILYCTVLECEAIHNSQLSVCVSLPARRLLIYWKSSAFSPHLSAVFLSAWEDLLLTEAHFTPILGKKDARNHQNLFCTLMSLAMSGRAGPTRYKDSKECSVMRVDAAGRK